LNEEIIPQQFNDLNGDEIPIQSVNNNQMDFDMTPMPSSNKEHSNEEDLMT
jgi:hypothetical protein